MQFRQFIENTNAEFPDLMTWVRVFFAHRMDLTGLHIYADWLEERGLTEQAQFFRMLSQWRNPKLKTGPWQGQMIQPFYKLFGHQMGPQHHVTETGSTWFIHPQKPSPGSHYAQGGYDRYSQMSRHIVFPGETSYALSLTNGKWGAYKNTGTSRVCVVSTRHKVTPESERWFPEKRITLRDYQPTDLNQVPDDVLFFAFYRLIEKQIRGGH
jgi:uncharacterized protein (TIGR02996 family)